jgi:hypothetical protein
LAAAGGLGYAAGSGALDGIGSAIGSAIGGLIGEEETDEGWKGQLAGGTAGTLAGGALGAVSGPIGAAVGGALGGTAGQMIGDKLGGPDEEQLNEVIGPAIAAGARVLIPLLSRVGPAIGRMASKGGQAVGQAAKSAAPAVGQAAKQGAQAVGQVAKQGAEIAAKNAVPIGVGVGAYQAITDVAQGLIGGVGEIYNDIGSAAEAITKAVGGAVDGKTIGELAAAAVKYAIPIGILLAVLYGGKKLIDQVMAEGADDSYAGLAGKAVGASIPNPGDFVTGFKKTFEVQTDETIDPTNPRDYELPAIQRKQAGQAPLTRQDVKQKDRKAEFDFYKRAHGKPHPDSVADESKSPLAGQYGHAGRMKEVSKDTSFLDRLKELSGMKK